MQSAGNREIVGAFILCSPGLESVFTAVDADDTGREDIQGPTPSETGRRNDGSNSAIAVVQRAPAEWPH